MGWNSPLNSPTVGRICLKLFPFASNMQIYMIYISIFGILPTLKWKVKIINAPPWSPRVTRIHTSTGLLPMFSFAAMLGYSTQRKKKKDCLLTLHHKEVPKEDVFCQKKMLHDSKSLISSTPPKFDESITKEDGFLKCISRPSKMVASLWVSETV